MQVNFLLFSFEGTKNLGPVVKNLTKMLSNVTLKFLSCYMANMYIDIFCRIKNESNFCIATCH